MNEKFSELAANIPELVEAIAAGKRPTKGEIVKASIARHQDQERRVRELMHEVQMLRSGSNGASTPNSFSALETPSPLTSVAPEPVLSTPQLSMPYQVQASHPIGLATVLRRAICGSVICSTRAPFRSLSRPSADAACP